MTFVFEPEDKDNPFVTKYLGTTNGDFKVIAVSKYYKDKECHGKRMFRIKCSICGLEKEVTAGAFNFSKNPMSHKHCGASLNMKGTRFYSIWANMRTRTTNSNYEKWKKYGGRGINSDCWKYFFDFYADMYVSYVEHCKKYGEEDTSLDRIDVDGNYSIENCQWATMLQQAGNKTNTLEVIIKYPDGTTKKIRNLKRFCESNNITYNNVISNLRQTNQVYHNISSNLYFIRLN